ncbi:hypothetical protein [Isoptericola croceus]|uniref:hypothetical protein n=1 Tax=Isoptericola croceus TaxID=3031406 RepID=UPI0023F77C89|nr:hypothetical protein [Isoptericola croceus]
MTKVRPDDEKVRSQAILQALPTLTAGVGYIVISMLVIVGHPISYVLIMIVPVVTVLTARLATYYAGRIIHLTPRTSGYVAVVLTTLLLGYVSLLIHFPGPAFLLGLAFLLLGIAHRDARACSIAFGAMVASVPLDIMGPLARSAVGGVEVWKSVSLSVVGMAIILISLYFVLRDRRLPRPKAR